jgi:hypothetical protein
VVCVLSPQSTLPAIVVCLSVCLSLSLFVNVHPCVRRYTYTYVRCRNQRGSECNIIVTQPRRISAVSLGTRVADERAEKVGETVGYSIRLESRRSAKTRILFCTTGVLLRQLHSDPTLQGMCFVKYGETEKRV